jgi:hypothetical protein
MFWDTDMSMLEVTEFKLNKLAVYEGITRNLFDIIAVGRALSEEEATKFVGLTTKGLLIYGADSVIQAYLEFKAAAGSPNLMTATAKLLLAMRADLGHYNKNLTPENILSMLVAKS